MFLDDVMLCALLLSGVSVSSAGSRCVSLVFVGTYLWTMCGFGVHLSRYFQGDLKHGREFSFGLIRSV